MSLLTDLITDETDVVRLRNDRSITLDEKNTVLGNINASMSKRDKYLEMIYLMNGNWYYLKKEGENAAYPLDLINELMGSYIVKSRGLKSLDHKIAKGKKGNGLISKDFHQQGYIYNFGDYFYDQYYETVGDYYNLSVSSLKNIGILTPNSSNAEKLLDEILNLIAIDTFMLQTDRGPANVQFATNKESGEVELSPIYDFSNCSSSINPSGLFLKDCLITITEESIRLLIKEFPKFSEYLSYLTDQGYLEIWNKICDDYHFNKDSQAYENITSHFKTKEESQKQYLYEFIKR